MTKKPRGTRSLGKDRKRAIEEKFMALVLLCLLIFLALLVGCQGEKTADGRQPTEEMTADGRPATVEMTADDRPAAVETTVDGRPTTVEVTADSRQATAEATADGRQSTADPMATVTRETVVTPTAEPRAIAPEGALVSVKMDGQVGVLLDEVPAEMRDRVAEVLMERPESYWSELAHRQTRLTLRRLNFRNFVYNNKGQLPLPPQVLWAFELDPVGPSRQTSLDGHDLVVIPYTFSSMLLADAVSVAEAEPALAGEGGKWDEPFILPYDPELLFQRTGNACLNEAGFPPNSFDSENAWVFFDFSCEADSGGPLGCHRTRLANQSCLDALDRRVGAFETEVQFERLAWDEELADSVRIGAVTHTDGPDLKVIGEDLENYRIVYRYFPADSCALVEQCVGDSGWRRLLQFNATVHNIGGEPMHIGPAAAENPVQNLFQYNACHDHFHFSDYGDFTLVASDGAGTEESISSKQAFCVESTNRFSNNEWSPLTHSYTCLFQGVQAGWVDEYVAGLDCQWIDITDIEIPEEGAPVTLGFVSNPDRFLCEGALVLDERGNPVWEPSGLTTADGRDIQRPQCEFVSAWDVNNEDSRELFVMPRGSFVTDPCDGGQIGPLRNCGFNPQEQEEIASCEPGEVVQLTCSIEDGSTPQVLRVCEYSETLGTGVACTFLDAVANIVVDREAAEVSFTCPLIRDRSDEASGAVDDEPGSHYSFYVAPVFGEDEPQPVNCTVN
jgi:hypothetical protein